MKEYQLNDSWNRQDRSSLLPAATVAGHVRPHVQVDVAATQVVGEGELLLVAEDEALVPEQLYKLGEAGVVLINNRKELV